MVTLTHSTIQNGVTALEAASIKGQHKVVELLLGAGANPDLQNKVRTVVCMDGLVTEGGMSCIL